MSISGLIGTLTGRHRIAWLLIVSIMTVMVVNAGLTEVASAQSETGGSQYPNLDISSPSAILIDALSGKVLFARDEHKRYAPASVTKIMTLLLAFESLERGQVTYEDTVVVSPNASEMGGSQMYLWANEEVTFRHVVKGVAIGSANDGAVAVAEHIGGSEGNFVSMMNSRAAELGMKNTTFANSHGLDDPNHLTTAYDIALMSREAVKHPELLRLSSIRHEVLTDGLKPRDLLNRNRLISSYSGCDGLKTGYTETALYCLSATAKRGDTRLIAVVMGARTPDLRTRDIVAMLNYGFGNYTTVPVMKKGDSLTERPGVAVYLGDSDYCSVVAEDDFGVTVERGQETSLERRIELPEQVVAPVEEGQPLGYIAVFKDGDELGQVNLVASKSIKRLNYLQLIWRLFTLVHDPR